MDWATPLIDFIHAILRDLILKDYRFFEVPPYFLGFWAPSLASIRSHEGTNTLSLPYFALIRISASESCSVQITSMVSTGSAP